MQTETTRTKSWIGLTNLKSAWASYVNDLRGRALRARADLLVCEAERIENDAEQSIQDAEFARSKARTLMQRARRIAPWLFGGNR